MLLGHIVHTEGLANGKRVMERLKDVASEEGTALARKFANPVSHNR
jgi:hypothetical protein